MEMQQYVHDLHLSPRWWWGTVAAVVVAALVFLAMGSTAGSLVCLVAAIAIAWLALSAGD